MTKTKQNQDWLRVVVDKDDPKSADLFILGFIGGWIDDLFEDFGFEFDSVKTAKKFKDELDSLPDGVRNLRLHVNSPGGDVFGAVTIANMLREQRTAKGRRIQTSVEGLAASAASIVIQAGDPVRIADNGIIMIHDPWTRVTGNAREIRKAAEELDTIKEDQLIATYKWHSSLSTEEIADMMSAETWLDADEAIAKGFATEKVEGLKAAACIDPRMMSALSVPEKYRDRVQAWLSPAPSTDPPEPEDAADAKEVLRLCREGGCLDVAEELVKNGASLKQVRTRIAAEGEQRKTAESRETEIRGLCKKAGLEELADAYISGQMPVEAVRAQLTHLTARIDGLEIDGGLDPDNGRSNNIADSWKKAFAKANRRFGARS